MPRDGSGVYSLPNGYLAVSGQTIVPSQHNPPLEDIGQAITDSVPRNGSAGMTGDLPMAGNKITDLGEPTSDADACRLQDARYWGMPIGAGCDFWGTTAPAGFMFAYGQAISRTTYAECFAELGTSNGAGDGSTTFNLPDKRGRASFGKDNMGGSTAGRITNAGSGIVGTTLGAAGGLETHTLTEAQLAVHDHTASTASAGAHTHSGSADSGGAHTHTASTGSAGAHTHSGTTDAAGNHQHTYTAPQATIFFGGGSGQNIPSINTGAATGAAGNHAHNFTTGSAGAHTHTVTVNSGGAHTHTLTVNSNGAHTHGVTVDNAGSGQAHNNVPPGIVCNYIIRVI